MQETTAASQRREPASDSTGYVRFVILGKGRTGSTMLIQALNSSPSIMCFGAIFNRQLDFVDFSVDGYDNFSAPDRRLRDQNPAGFLRERVFCRHAEGIGAVGFKYRYGQTSVFPGLLERLAEDAELRVLHLKRHNLLRSLVSARIAETTGVWFERRRPTLASKFRPSNALGAARHPLRATSRLWAFLRAKEPPWKSLRTPVTLSPEECLSQFRLVEEQAAHHDQLFQQHPKLTVYYEDFLHNRNETFDEVQSFLAIQPVPLTVTLRRQNPEPLRDLIANYDELYAAFKDSPEAAFFD